MPGTKIDLKALVAKFEAQARSNADAMTKDDNLARRKGASPEQIEARHRVARLFCENNFPKEAAAQRDARLAPFDFSQPVTTTNGRLVNLDNPKPVGFMGMGRKPAYLVSAAFPPKNEADPIYCLEYFPLKK